MTEQSTPQPQPEVQIYRECKMCRTIDGTAVDGLCAACRNRLYDGIGIRRRAGDALGRREPA